MEGDGRYRGFRTAGPDSVGNTFTSCVNSHSISSKTEIGGPVSYPKLAFQDMSHFNRPPYRGSSQWT
jgi:hypothetical protein